jgi:hypothetical protein
MSAESRQTSDSANSGSFGTTQLKPNQGSPLIASKLENGGASGNGTKEPAKDTGTR